MDWPVGWYDALLYMTTSHFDMSFLSVGIIAATSVPLGKLYCLGSTVSLVVFRTVYFQ